MQQQASSGQDYSDVKQQLSDCEAGFVDVQVPSKIRSSEPREFIPQYRQSKYNAISGRDRAPTLAADKKYYIFLLCVCSFSYAACNMHAPYYIVVCGCNVFFYNIL